LETNEADGAYVHTTKNKNCLARSAVDRYFVKEMIKTPKNLDTPNVFDFLGFPPPGTPRSAKMYRDLSPNRLVPVLRNSFFGRKVFGLIFINV
jgi:hypothetical protein